MRLPCSFRQHVDNNPQTPIAISLTMDDFAEMAACATALALYGVTWRVDAMDTVRPEVAIVCRNNRPNFQLWRTTTGLLLRCLGPKRDAATIALSGQYRACLLVCALTTPPIWLATDEEVTTGSRATSCLLKWIRE